MEMIPLKAYCEAHDISISRARRYAREGLFGQAVKQLGRWAVPEGMPVPLLPRANPHPGKERYFIWLTPTEFDRMKEDTVFVMGGAALHDLNVAETRRLQRAEAVAGTWLYRLLSWLLIATGGLK